MNYFLILALNEELLLKKTFIALNLSMASPYSSIVYKINPIDIMV